MQVSQFPQPTCFLREAGNLSRGKYATTEYIYRYSSSPFKMTESSLISPSTFPAATTCDGGRLLQDSGGWSNRILSPLFFIKHLHLPKYVTLPCSGKILFPEVKLWRVWWRWRHFWLGCYRGAVRLPKDWEISAPDTSLIQRQQHKHDSVSLKEALEKLLLLRGIGDSAKYSSSFWCLLISQTSELEWKSCRWQKHAAKEVPDPSCSFCKSPGLAGGGEWRVGHRGEGEEFQG